MSSISSKEMLLASVIAGEVGKMGGKFALLNIDHSDVQTLWESSASLDIEEVLAMIDIETDLPESYELALLYGIGWEFVWCRVPPKEVIGLRNEILAKAVNREELNRLETLWCQLISVDTDII